PKSTVRDYLRAGRVEWSRGWKGQRVRKLGKIYDAIEAEFPVLRRFLGSWGTEYLVKAAFNSHRTYTACKDDGLKYRGKMKRIRGQIAACRGRNVDEPSSDEEEEANRFGLDPPSSPRDHESD
ncbi:hypothetical protein BD779DRAFT_1475273, partial [Infundibulicybe gibba]